MSDEAFPNAERLFQQAFSATDPAPLLLQLLKEYPTYPAVRDLVVYYTEAVEEDPYRGQSLASTLCDKGGQFPRRTYIWDSDPFVPYRSRVGGSAFQGHLRR